MSDTTLKLLTAKKETLFRRLQLLYDAGRRAKTDERQQEIFKIRYETLNETKRELDEIIERINEIELDLDPEFVPNFSPIEAVDEMFCYIQIVTKDILQTPTQPNPFTSATQKIALKLPNIDLPCFSGVQSEWPVFYETFKSLIHDNTDFNPVNKLHYLLGKLSGKALNVCSGIAPNAANYSIWNALIEKYEDKRALANCYMDQIISFKPAQTENVHCFNAFLEKFDPAVKALKSLQKTDLTDFMLAYLALSKIDKETIKLFEIKRRKHNDLPTYQKILDFIREQPKILTFSSKKFNKSSFGNSSKQKPVSIAPAQTRSFFDN